MAKAGVSQNDISLRCKPVHRHHSTEPTTAMIVCDEHVSWRASHTFLHKMIEPEIEQSLYLCVI